MNLRFFFGILLLINFACTKEEITIREYPRLRTLMPTNLTNHGGVLNGKITYATADIQDHGFVWSNSGFPNINKSEVVSLGPISLSGDFSASINYEWTIGETYLVRAYARSSNHVVYGESITVAR